MQQAALQIEGRPGRADKRPGRIRFQYEKGVPFLIVSDGSAFTFVDYQVRQVQRWPIKNSPLGALLDPNRDVAKYGKQMPVSSPNIVSVEVRDKAHPEFGVITLVFVRKHVEFKEAKIK